MNHFLSNFKSPWSIVQAKLGVEKEEMPASSDTAAIGDGDQQQTKLNTAEHSEEVNTGDKMRPSQIANRVFGIAKKASSKLQEKATNISTIVSERTLIGNIERERQKFMEELRKEDECVDEIGLDGLLANVEVQQHIVAISSNPNNLTEEPPFTFDLDSDIALVKQYAEALFRLDPRLAALRFELVPKQVPEDKFWRNYAYRISLVRKFVNEKCTLSGEQQISTTEEKNNSTEDAKPVEPLENDEEKLEKELLNDLNEFEVVDGGKKDDDGSDDKMSDELDKQLDELLESN